jgi:hypothetical protein
VGQLLDLKNNHWFWVFERTNKIEGIIGFKYLRKIEPKNYWPQVLPPPRPPNSPLMGEKKTRIK